MTRARHRSSGRPVAALIACLASLASSAQAAWQPEGVDLQRPRILFRAADLPTVQARMARQPYRTVVADMLGRTRLADGVALDDHGITAARFKARAAKNLAFLYAVDRTLVAGEVVPFPSAAEREAAGRRVHDLLLSMYTRSRLNVPPPLGGWDRDISTSEELLQYATAFDTMLGAGYDFGGDQVRIADHIADVATELYGDYLDGDTAAGTTSLHQNNHRSKSGAALVVAAIALAEYTAPAGTDPTGRREPTAWLEYGLDQVDLVMRHVLVTGDGAYGEGPFYLRFAAQNLLPFARAWDRLIGGAAWPARGLMIPSLWRHPLFVHSQRWLLDMTLPDGSLAPIDDGNPGRSYYFGAAPVEPALASAFAWRWANAPTPFETDGNIDLGADTIVTFDDSVPPAPPRRAPTAFYAEGGTATLRSDWSSDAVTAIVLGEHDTASEFGRNRDGLGVSPQSHEHAEPGAFILHAFGERLAVDPGYFEFSDRFVVNKPEDHNIILVDELGPVDYLNASLSWQHDLAGRPPADGQASLARLLDADVLDAVAVATRYGQPPAHIRRRFLFPLHRYVVIADRVSSTSDGAHVFTWLLHGNGDVAAGTFDFLSAGGRWTRPRARLDAALAATPGGLLYDLASGIHEEPGRVEAMHTVLRASAAGADVHAVQLLYPSRTTAPPPQGAALELAGAAGVVLADASDDRRVLAVHRPVAAESLVVPPAQSNLRAAATDGTLLLVDTDMDGHLRAAWVEGATTLTYDETTFVQTATPGDLGMLLGEGRADLVLANRDRAVTVTGLPFTARAADGACGFAAGGGATVLVLGRERRVSLRAAAGNSAPAADPGADERVPVGALVRLNGRASCDADGDDLTPRWTLRSAPAGSAWMMEDADTWEPAVVADRPGPYRVHLVVNDGRVDSRVSEVRIIAGDPCADGVDDDLDGLFDTDDPDCDQPPACTGDCSANGVVDVGEFIRGIGIATGKRSIAQCPRCDRNGDGRVGVTELRAATANLVAGCTAP